MDKVKKMPKPIVCRRQTIIERGRLLDHNDIINDTHYSGKHGGSKTVAYWTDENTGEILVSDAYSRGTRKGAGWYFPTATSQPVLPKLDWTPNYTGQGYTEIPEWIGGTGDVVELTVVNEALSNRQILWGGLSIYTSSSGYLTTGEANCKLFVDGIEVNSTAKRLELGVTYAVKIVLTESANVVGIAYHPAPYQWEGELTDISLTNTDGSDSRFYESIIKSPTQPATFELVDSIHGKNGTMLNFPSNEEWKDITEVTNG